MLPNINLFHLTLLVALLFVGDWMTPTPSYRAHPFHRGGGRVTTVQLYPQHITTYLTLPSVNLFDLAFNIWSYHVTYFSIHASRAWNQLSSSYPTSCIAVGWMTPTPSQDPPIPQGGGGLMLWPWPWQGGWGGDPEPGTYIHIHIPHYIYIYYTYLYSNYLQSPKSEMLETTVE